MSNNIRHDSSYHYINQDEVNRQIADLSDSGNQEHREKVARNYQQFYQNIQDRKDSGEDVSAEEAEILLQHRINAATPTRHHEVVWAEKNKVALEMKKIKERMMVLANKYRDKKIDDETYYSRYAKLKTNLTDLEKKI